MRLINVETYELESFFDHRKTPAYAILSHTWDEDEVLFEDVRPVVEVTKQKRGWKKIEYTCEQAKKDGLKYAWVDTCCIRKSSSAELSEAINSMFAWYEESRVCYAYLADVELRTEAGVDELQPGTLLTVAPEDDTSHVATACESPAAGQEKRVNEKMDLDGFGTILSDQSMRNEQQNTISDTEDSRSALQAQFKASKWFTRGWTLQELLAPKLLRFFSATWQALGSLRELYTNVRDVTGIPQTLLLRETRLELYCAARRMSWAARRKTSRIEDEAYCLLGLLQINMSLLYGERHNAFQRLQLEVLRATGDLSILAWDGPSTDTNLLARSAIDFVWSGHLRTADARSKPSVSISSDGIKVPLPVSCFNFAQKSELFIPLNCYDYRFPDKVVALGTHESSRLESDIAVNVGVRDRDDSRLYVLDRWARTGTAFVNLLFTDKSLNRHFAAPRVHLRLPQRKSGCYRATLQDIFPAHRWNRENMTYQSGSNPHLHRRDLQQTTRLGFVLSITPEPVGHELAIDAKLTWLMEFRLQLDGDIGDRSSVATSAVIDRITCYENPTDSAQAHVYTAHRRIGQCETCERRLCRLFEATSTWQTIVFKGLVGHDQVRIEEHELGDGEIALYITIEGRRRALLRTLHGDCVSATGRLLSILSKLSDHFVRAMLLGRRPRTREEVAVSYLRYWNAWVLDNRADVGRRADRDAAATETQLREARRRLRREVMLGEREP